MTLAKSISSIIGLLLICVAAKAEVRKIAVKEITGKAVVSILGTICSDEEWSTLKPWLKKNSYTKMKFEPTTYELNGPTVSVPARKTSITFKKNGHIEATVSGRSFKGTPCGVVVELSKIDPKKKTTAFSLLVPQAEAYEAPTELTTSERVRVASEVALFTGIGAFMGLPGAIAGFAIGAKVASDRVEYLEGWIAPYRNILEAIAKQTLEDDELHFVSCSPSTVVAKAGKNVLIITTGPKGSIRVNQSHDGATGNLSARWSPMARGYAMAYTSCTSADDAKELNRANARGRVRELEFEDAGASNSAVPRGGSN